MTPQQPGNPSADPKNNLSDTVIRRWLLAAVAAGLVWRVARMALHFEITGDEAGILRSVMERSYSQLLAPLSYFNVSPPMFLWMTKLADSVFHSDWASRCMPFLAGIAALALFGLMCRKVLTGNGVWMAWAIFSVAYVPVVEGTRAKGYTIDLLVAMLMLWWMLRWLLDGTNARFLVILCAAAPVFIWLSYTSVFVIGAIGFVFLVWLAKPQWVAPVKVGGNAVRDWRNVTAGLLFLGLSAASAILLFKINVHPALAASAENGLSDGWKRGYPPDRLWQIPQWLLASHTGRGFAWPVGENHYGSAFTFILWLAGLAFYWRSGNRWVWALFLAPQALSLFAGILHKYPYLQNPRICMFLGPGICIFAGHGAQHLIDLLSQVKRQTTYLLASIALMACAIGGLARDGVLRWREIKAHGMRSTLSEASRRAGAETPFVMLNDENASGVFEYYLHHVVEQPLRSADKLAGDIPPHGKMALVAIGVKPEPGHDEALLADFERRCGRPVKIAWSQKGSQVLIGGSDTISVWLCDFN